MLETEQSKLTSIFRYLKQLDSLRRRPAEVAVPDLPCPVPVPCPRPPSKLTDWLEPGWDDPERAVVLTNEREFELSGDMFCRVFFQDDEDRVILSKQWLEQRDAWALEQIKTKQREVQAVDATSDQAEASAYQDAVDRILVEIENGALISPALLTVVGLAEQTEPSSSVDVASAEDANLLLSKFFNESQIRVARRITHNDAVLVQGPPGTGKTHTIANILGHLLADGKTVLVTAHTSKSLGVLREMVVPAVRPLCISVLDDNSETLLQLDSAVQAMTRKLAESDRDVLLHEAEELAARRGRIFTGLSDTKTALFNARFEEMQDVTACGETFSPTEAARIVSEGATQHSWLPGPLTANSSPPLSQEEAGFLYQSAGLISEEDEQALIVALPDPAALPSPSEVALLINDQSRLSASAVHDHSEYWLPVEPPALVEQFDTLLPRIRTVANSIRPVSGWWLEVVRAGRHGGITRTAWEYILDQVRVVGEQADAATPLLQAHQPELSPPAADEAGVNDEVTLNEIRAHLAAKGTLGIWTKTTRRLWHKLIDRAKVNGQKPQNLEHFEAIDAFIKLKAARETLRSRWQRQVGSAGGPDASTLGEQPERAALPIVSDIHARLDWYDSLWRPLHADLLAVGFQWDAFASEIVLSSNEHGEMARLRAAIENDLENVVRAHRDLLALQHVDQSVRHVSKKLQAHSGNPVVRRALSALAQHDSIAYADAGRDMSRLLNFQDTAIRRRDLLGRLDAVAPAWTAQIRDLRNSLGVAKVPSNIEAAWQWRQLHDELESRAQNSMPDLQSSIDLHERDLKAATAQLIERKAWAAQKQRVTPSLQASLEGYLGCIQKVAESTGERGAALRAAANEHLSAALAAVPVWIMPLNRVYENFFPSGGSQRFDVVIIDEASQCDVTALAALHLGRKCIIVGDEAQVTPESSADLDAVQDLINGSLREIPNSELYDPENSVYQLARSFFKERIFLREHFRSVPEIAQFSNYLSYDGRMCPLRDSTASLLKPSLVAHRVSGSRSPDNTNHAEAREIAALLMACLEEQEYAVNDLGQPASFGVISLHGDEQVALIDSLLRTQVSAEAFAKHRILCGSAAQFQGDERDVMFLSLVDSGNGQPLPLMGFGVKEIHRKLFNVAASRARNQMWVVHSLDPALDLQPGDLRLRLIEHALHPLTLLNAAAPSHDITITPLTLAVQEYLVKRGYSVRACWPAGSARIGLVAWSGEHRLAIECDGDRLVTALELVHDMERQSALERTGWRFVRVRGSVFTRDPERAMKPVLDALALHEIKPSGGKSFLPSNTNTELALLDRLRRRAKTVRSALYDEAAIPEAPEPVVSVGDWVEFILLEAPENPEFVNIVETPTDLDKCEVNVSEALACALLGRSVTEITRLVLDDYQPEIQVKGIYPKGHPSRRVKTF